jgi:hypothetical protein
VLNNVRTKRKKSPKKYLKRRSRGLQPHYDPLASPTQFSDVSVAFLEREEREKKTG